MSSDTNEPPAESQAGDDRGISVGRDASGNAFVTGDNNQVKVVIYQSVIEERDVQPSKSKDVGENPYMGLLAFHEQDADRFFGRETQITKLWEKLRDLVQDSPSKKRVTRLLPILGPSGSGKSSLARAGLIPELARQELPGWRQPRVAVLTPGSHPLESLARILARIATGDRTPVAKTDEFKDALSKRNAEQQFDGLRRIADAFPDIATSPLIVLIDQFEEIYSLCDSKDDRLAFIENLLHAASDANRHLTVVLTLRTDFLGDTQRHEALNALICNDEQHVMVPSMSEEELRAAITKPAELRDHPLDDATVELLIQDTKDHEGTLPLMQFALKKIWDGFGAGKTAAETYREIGGVGGALAQEAQRIFDSLDEDGQRVAKRVFLGLVQLGEGTRDTRRRAGMDEFQTLVDDSSEIRNVVRRFADRDARLITVSSGSEEVAELANAASLTAEVTHEALIENWGLLGEWLNEDRDDIRFSRRLDEAAESWKNEGRPGGGLWRPPYLDLLEKYHDRRSEDMSPGQIDFYVASKQAETERLAAERRLQQRLLILLSTAATLLVLAVTAFVWALVSRSHAIDAREGAIEAKETAIEAEKKAEAARLAEAEQRKKAEKAEQLAKAAEVVAKNERDKAVEARKAEEVQRKKAEAATLAEAEQRKKAEERRVEAQRSRDEAQRGRIEAEADAILFSPPTAARERIENLGQLLDTDEPRQYAIEVLEKKLSERPPDDATIEEEYERADNQANIAVALVQLDAVECLSPDLRHEAGEDTFVTTLRTEFIHRFQEARVDPEHLVSVIDEKQDPSILYSLLLSLGSLGSEAIEGEQRNKLVETVARLYEAHPDAGVRAAAEWLLRQWGESSRISKIDKSLRDRDLPDHNWHVTKTGLKMVKIPAGDFMMGSPDWGTDKNSDEEYGRVTIETGFYLSSHEITQELYQSVMGRNPSRYDDENEAPVETVTWYDAVDFCNRLSDQEGLEKYYEIPEVRGDGENILGAVVRVPFPNGPGYRLPSEEEWEYACRAGTLTKWSSGNSEKRLREYAWYGDLDGSTHVVGLRKPNSWGLFDIHGNVWEWTDSFYREGSESRVLRGGSFNLSAGVARAAYRVYDNPAYRFDLHGFRVARTYD